MFDRYKIRPFTYFFEEQLEMNSQPTEPQNRTRLRASSRTGCVAKLLSFKIMLVFWVLVGIVAFVLTAPPLEGPKEPPKLRFHGRAALRKRPTTDSKPIAYTNAEGTHRFSLGLDYLSNLEVGTLPEKFLFSVGVPAGKNLDEKIGDANWKKAFADHKLPSVSDNATVKVELTGQQWRIIDESGAAYTAKRDDVLLNIYTEDLWEAFANHKISLTENARLSTLETGEKWLIQDDGIKQAYNIEKERAELKVYQRTKLEIVQLLFYVDSVPYSDLDKGVVPEALAQAFEKQQIPLSQDMLLATENAGKRWSIIDEQQKYTVQRAGGRLNVYLNLDSDWLYVRIEGEIKGWTQREQGVIIQPPPRLPTQRQKAKNRLLRLVGRGHAVL
jgi:hypothetical protein